MWRDIAFWLAPRPKHCKCSYAVQAQLPRHDAAHSGLGSLMLIVNYSDALQMYSDQSVLN